MEPHNPPKNQARVPSSKPNLFRFYLQLHLPQKLILIFLTLLSLGLVSFGAWNFLSRSRVYRLVIGSGLEKGESYAFSLALKQVVEANEPSIKIEVRTTGGTSENLKLLEKEEIQLATAQADIPGGNSTKLIAVLYPDAFQLVVKEKSKIQRFSDLKGKAIALPQKGGQYQSFLEVADHFGLQASDFRFVGNSEDDSVAAFVNNQADAVWRVRALRYKPILTLIQQFQARLLPIDQAAAMRLKHPAFEAAVIPQGSYRGNPPIPVADLSTVFVQRTLMTHKSVDEEVVRKITMILLERKQELADRVPKEMEDIKPLFAYISRPGEKSGIPTPLHPGAIAYYEREKRSFVQENAEFLGLLLTLTLLSWSWLGELKNWIEGRKKDVADVYINVVLELMNDKNSDVDVLLQDLDRVFERIAHDLVNEKVSQESFRTFNEAYKTARETIERKRLLVKQQRKDIAGEYVKQAIALLQDGRAGTKSATVLRELDDLLEKITIDLSNDLVSQEAYRTFMEAYKTVQTSIAQEPNISALKTTTSESQQERITRRNQFLSSLAEKIYALNSIDQVWETRGKLLKIWQEVTREAESQQISAMAFQIFHFNWQVCMEAINNRERVLQKF